MSIITLLPHLDATKRHDAVFLFDVKDGNPNGDPDAGNLPRMDPETSEGLVTDVAIKRKIRNYVQLARDGHDGYEIFVQERGKALNALIGEAYENLNLNPKVKDKDKRIRDENIGNARARMCQRFFDIRAFGAVLSTGDVGAGQVRGPVQLTFSRSVDPILPLDHTITRVAITKVDDDKRGEMGRKATVPYGLYVGHLFVSSHQAKDTKFSDDDLKLVWDALGLMWDFDHSAARGTMAMRGVHIFSHDNPLGNAPAHKLIEQIKLAKREDDLIPRAFTDYEIATPGLGALADYPGVTYTQLWT